VASTLARAHSSGMKDFVVTITTTIPDGTDPAEVDRRRAAEKIRAKELAATGHLYRIWRPAGEKRSIGIWRGEDERDLRENVLGTLPLWPWMSAEIVELESHPNDPVLNQW
jgi:muconolactone D-isomerase